MNKRNLLFLLVTILSCCVSNGFSQITLGTSPFTENFNGISGGVPTGFSVRTGASASTIGASAALTTAPTAWSNTTGAFKNSASATGLTQTSTTTEQAASTNRALSIRQTGAVGDPGAAFVFQIDNTLGKTDFLLNFKLQSLDAASARTTTWTIDYAIGASPTVYIPLASSAITGDLTTGTNLFKNTSVTADFSNILNNQSQMVTIRIVTLSATTGANSRATTGVDDFTLSWNSGASTTPIITLNDNGATALQFPATYFNTMSVRSYLVRGENLTTNLDITAPTNFSLSTDSVNFSSSLSLLPADVTANKKIFVGFVPTAATVYNGSVSNVSAGATSKSISVSGEGIDSTALSFDFNTCANAGAPGSGFSAYSVTGAQVWACTTFGYNNTNGVNMNGFASTAQTNEDWLISPPLKFGSLSLPVLSFMDRAEFNGPDLQVLISTNYSGAGDPNLATWTTLGANLSPAASNVWTLTDNINLSPYKSSPKAYIAFKYISSPTLGAARWTLDSMVVSNKSTLLSVTPAAINFPETSVGNNSAGLPVNMQAIGYGDITVAAPANYQVSLNNSAFSSSIVVPQASLEAGTVVYARFSPTVKALSLTGRLTLTGTGLNQTFVNLSSSSYPRSETFDVACYNMSFFGANSNNTATPAAIATQVANLAIVYQRLNADIIGFEEMSNEVALDSLKSKLPGYSSVTSQRWSYSFEAPDPTFPPQKVGFLFNTATTTLVSSRVMFEAFYDSVRAGTNHRIDDYPTGTPSSFWASGRLPFMATFNTTINGITKQVRMIVIHAKALGDADGFTRRRYDAKLLKDSLDVFYPNDIIFLVGDYNDRMVSSTFSGSTVSPFLPFLNTPADTVLTYALDAAGTSSFIGSGGEPGMIDHIMVSNELAGSYIAGSTAIEPANTYIAGYSATTASDHLPVYSRFSFDAALPVTLLKFDAKARGTQVLASWSTASEQHTSHFVVEKSTDGRNYSALGRVQAVGNSTVTTSYSLNDLAPAKGANYYRLQQVDADGRTVTSATILVWFDGSKATSVQIYPNPVVDYIKINSASQATDLTARIFGADGRVLVQAYGDVANINQQLDTRLVTLKPGMYILQLGNASEKTTLKFIKQ